MYLLKEGREPFLAFLRNLTPQSLLLIMAFFAGRQLDTTHFSLSTKGGLLSAIFVLFIIMWFLAFIANTSIFLDNASAQFFPTRPKKITSKQPLKSPYNGYNARVFKWGCKFIWRKRKLFFLEFALIMAMTELGMLATFIAAMLSASK